MPGAANRARRLARLQSRQVQALRARYPFGLPARERRYCEYMERVHAWLRRALFALGHDPDIARSLTGAIAANRARLAALPPSDPGREALLPRTPRSSEEIERGRQFRERFDRAVENYRDPATPAPDIENESVVTLWAYAWGRLDAATRD